MESQPSDQKRHIRQALADLVFGLALFALFVLLGVFGVKQASSDVSVPVQIEQEAPLPKEHPDGVLRNILLPLEDRT